jgi:GNAT superfamily N-acetyltransferase
MTARDMPGAVAVSAGAFGLDLTDPGAKESWTRRVAHAFDSDPAGCFVAETGGRIVGLSQALRRETLWVLSMLTVDPITQGSSAGRGLFDRAQSYADGTEYGLIVSSSDPRALHLYASAGFSIRPALNAVGQIEPGSLPAPSAAITEVTGDDGELEGLADVSRAVRGGPHTPELRFALAEGWPVLRHGDRGFAVAAPRFNRIWLLVARDEDAADELMTAALGRLAGPAQLMVRWITGGQDWAVRAALAAGLRLEIGSAVAVRGGPATTLPYIPSGPFG